jgi:hypothetical protein
MTVTANADGTLEFASGRWIAVDSLRFVHQSGSGYIVFRSDSSGVIRELFAGGFWGWQKLQVRTSQTSRPHYARNSTYRDWLKSQFR